MADLGPEDNGPTDKEKAWAAVRMVLGLGQMMGAVGSFYLLTQLGLNEVSLAAVMVTCFLTTVSVVLFGGRKR